MHLVADSTQQALCNDHWRPPQLSKAALLGRNFLERLEPTILDQGSISIWRQRWKSSPGQVLSVQHCDAFPSGDKVANGQQPQAGTHKVLLLEVFKQVERYKHGCTALVALQEEESDLVSCHQPIEMYPSNKLSEITYNLG